MFEQLSSDTLPANIRPNNSFAMYETLDNRYDMRELSSDIDNQRTLQSEQISR